MKSWTAKDNNQPLILSSINSSLKLMTMEMVLSQDPNAPDLLENSLATHQLKKTWLLTISTRFGINMILIEVDTWTEWRLWDSWTIISLRRTNHQLLWPHSTDSSIKLISMEMMLFPDQRWPHSSWTSINLKHWPTVVIRLMIWFKTFSPSMTSTEVAILKRERFSD